VFETQYEVKGNAKYSYAKNCSCLGLYNLYRTTLIIIFEFFLVSIFIFTCKTKRLLLDHLWFILHDDI